MTRLIQCSHIHTAVLLEKLHAVLQQKQYTEYHFCACTVGDVKVVE